MALDTEAIWDALAERLRDGLAGSVKSTERRFRPQYAEVELPACVVMDDEGTEDLASDVDKPGPVWRLSGEVWILARTVETDAAPTTQLNALVMAVREALEFDPAAGDTAAWGRVAPHYTTLGGKVRSLAITKVEKMNGALAGTSAAQVTITMEAPEGA